MKRVVLFILIFILSLDARENPFAPIDTPKIKKPIIDKIDHQKLFEDIKEQRVKATYESNPKKAVASTNPPQKSEKKRFLVPPIILPDKPAPTDIKQISSTKDIKNFETLCICDQNDLSTKPPVKRKKFHKKRHKIKKRRSPKYTTIYQNYFVTIKRYGDRYQIITKDRLMEKKYLKSPMRVALDFKRVQYFKTKQIKSKKSRIKIGSHHCFWRVTVTSKHRYKIIKKPYGYLLY